jgi:hypothetical protein
MVLFVSDVRADVLVDSQGFEAPGYAVGDLLQNDASAGDLPGQTGWLESGNAANTATVENTVAYAGTQAVQVNRNSPPDTRWGVTGTYVPTSSQQISITWAMNVLPTYGNAYITNTATPPDNGPFFGSEVYDEKVTIPATSGPGLFASLGVDASTGHVLYQQTTTHQLIDSGTTVNLGWNLFGVVLNFATDQYNLYLNGSLLTTQSFIDGSVLTKFTDADISTLATGGDPGSQNETGTAYFDNFVVQAGPIPVPEPSMLVGLSGLAACLCVAWCRRR